MLKVGVVGASGYGGGELLRLLLSHSHAKLNTAISETYAGKPLYASFPGLARRTDLTFSSYGDGTELAECDVVFLAQENGKAMETAPHLLEAGCKIVDLSADFRFRDASIYQKWYGKAHSSSGWNDRAVYGLPELNREHISKAQIVGNPGCYATASILAIAPLLNTGRIVPDSIIVDGKSGVSGAGRSKFSLEYHYPEMNESVSAYKAGGTHRHTPEIEAALSTEDSPVQISFTPHLIPMTRGILASCYATLTQPMTREALLDIYRRIYADAPFVFVSDDLPSTKHTVGTNMCHIGLAVDARLNRVTIFSAIDNLLKGAAGQAIQNMNLMCGLPETAGLELGGIWP